MKVKESAFMSIKPHKGLSDLITVLDGRNLKLDDNTEKTLKEINYFQLVNGIENLLLPMDKQFNGGKKSLEQKVYLILLLFMILIKK